MPLGLFGNKDGGPKGQPLTNEKEEKKKEKGEKSSSSKTAAIDLNDCKGASIKLGKKSFTVEKKLAEGGFAIVYLVCDKHNRYYALKRQLIRDDPRQVDACRTECQIVKNLNGHKNIVAYIDHQLSVNKAGIYDYMLLTVYYKTNVLQLMNTRLLANKWLTISEILDIFCDMCEAVARLHHSKTPVIHRDLKVENVLIDQRTGSEKPVYVLCDFGSATTKVLSQETHSQSYMEEEIKRYTTLSYRAPEMIDLFCGVPIDTKSDIWAMGVMLYKLCYFALPFGESALAIQNGTFTFPENPTITDEIKAIINLLLTSNAKHRPNIFQASYLAFNAANKKCPKSPRIELSEAVQILMMRDKLGSNYARALEKAFNEFEERKKLKETQNTQQPCTSFSNENHKYHQVNIAANVQTPVKVVQATPTSPQVIPRTPTQNPTSVTSPTSRLLNEGIIVNTAEPHRVLVTSTEVTMHSTTTSVNPRLRPKPTTTVTGIVSTMISGPPVSPRIDQSTPTPSRQGPPVPLKPSTSNQNLGNRSLASDTPDAIGIPINKTLEAFDSMKISQISTESSKSAPDYVTAAQLQSQNPKTLGGHQFVVVSASATLPTTSLHSSAFQPYSMSSREAKQRPPRLVEKEQRTISVSSNPFLEAPFTPGSPGALDDNAFGERFDEIRRVNRRNTIAIANQAARLSSQQDRARLPDVTNPYAELQPDPELARIIEEDPFGAAPIHPNQCLNVTGVTSPPLPNPSTTFITQIPVQTAMVNSPSRGHLRTMSTPHWNH